MEVGMEEGKQDDAVTSIVTASPRKLGTVPKKRPREADSSAGGHDPLKVSGSSKKKKEKKRKKLFKPRHPIIFLGVGASKEKEGRAVVLVADKKEKEDLANNEHDEPSGSLSWQMKPSESMHLAGYWHAVCQVCMYVCMYKGYLRPLTALEHLP